MSDADIDWNDDAPICECGDPHCWLGIAAPQLSAHRDILWPRHVVSVADVTSSTGDFGKDVAREHRDLKEHFARKPVHSGEGPVPAGSVDRSVAEQVHADLDGMIRKNEKVE